EGIPDIHFARLSSADVVRHKLVSEIVDAYGRYDATQAAQEPKAIHRGKRRP
ncbi:MAG: PhoH family protein, partial [Nonomuraea sp.]|nr:PhoH family protein [Nonomuraea sp.]